MSYLNEEEKKYIREEFEKFRRPPWYKPGKWSVSYYNFEEEVRKPMQLPKKVSFCDITIRTLPQVKGISPSKEQIIRLATELDATGVPIIDAFMWGLKKPEDAKFLTDLGLKAKIIMSCMSKDLIDLAADGGLDIAIIMSPSTYWLSPVYLHSLRRDAWEGKPIRSKWKSADEQFAYDVELIEYGKSRGLEVVASANMLSYSTIEYLTKKIKIETEAGADWVAIYDGQGGMGPGAWRYVVSKLKKAFPTVPIEVHAHQDFGLALANSLAAVEAGAEIIDVTVNGLGEHAGQADLAMTAAALETLYAIPTGIKLENLTKLKVLVEDITGIKMTQSQPITGDAVFSDCISEITEELWVDPFIHFWADPGIFGNKRDIWIGVSSDEWVLNKKLKELGIQLDRKKVTNLLQELRTETYLRRRALTNEEIIAIAKRY